jgi:hypothetical protein
LAHSHRTPLELWHLLSLDAPTVAALWCWTLGRASHLRLPLIAPMMLAMGAWVVYVLDRILDALQSPPELLRARHRFHLQHRRGLLAAVAADVLLLLVLVPTRMTAAALRENTFLGGCVLLYILVVHLPQLERLRRAFPKEIAVGLIFASATAVPAWSRLGRRVPGRSELLPIALAFAALCWLNCYAIDRWEAGPIAVETHSRQSLRSVPVLSLLVGAAILCAAAILRHLEPVQGEAALLAMALSVMGLGLLDRLRSRWPALRLRAAADLVLLTPVLFYPVPR